MPREEELRILLARTAEAAELDFKSKFEVADAGGWLEIIKDIAAFVNSAGGRTGCARLTAHGGSISRWRSVATV
jgi:hypothetical protein